MSLVPFPIVSAAPDLILLLIRQTDGVFVLHVVILALVRFLQLLEEPRIVARPGGFVVHSRREQRAELGEPAGGLEEEDAGEGLNEIVIKFM